MTLHPVTFANRKSILFGQKMTLHPKRPYLYPRTSKASATVLIILLLTILKANESDASKLAFLDGIDPTSPDWATVTEAALEAEWWADADSLLAALVKGTVNGNALRLALELDPRVYRVVVELAWDRIL